MKTKTFYTTIFHFFSLILLLFLASCAEEVVSEEDAHLDVQKIVMPKYVQIDKTVIHAIRQHVKEHNEVERPYEMHYDLEEERIYFLTRNAGDKIIEDGRFSIRLSDVFISKETYDILKQKFEQQSQTKSGALDCPGCQSYIICIIIEGWHTFVLVCEEIETGDPPCGILACEHQGDIRVYCTNSTVPTMPGQDYPSCPQELIDECEEP